MVDIKYYPEKHNLKMSGHANYTATGEDIVCAACSAIYYNLRAVLGAYDKKDAFCKFSIREASGKVSLTCVPNTDYSEQIEHDIWYCLTGFYMLQANYPENVKIEVIASQKA